MPTLTKRTKRAVASATPEWLRGPAQLRDGLVVLDVERAERYRVRHGPELLYDLAGIRRPPDVLPFVRARGLLWHGLDAAEHAEPVEEWERVAVELTDFMRLHADIRRSVEGERDALRNLDRFVARARRGDLAATASRRRSGTPSFARPGQRLSEEDTQLVETAVVMLAEAINYSLRDVREGVTPTLQGGGVSVVLAFAPQTPDLVSAAWHELAMLVTSDASLVACPECGRFFAPTDRRQRYCKPLCGGRARQRRFAERRRSER